MEHNFLKKKAGFLATVFCEQTKKNPLQSFNRMKEKILETETKQAILKIGRLGNRQLTK